MKPTSREHCEASAERRVSIAVSQLYSLPELREKKSGTHIIPLLTLLTPLEPLCIAHLLEHLTIRAIMADLRLFELHFDHGEGHEPLLEGTTGSVVEIAPLRSIRSWEMERRARARGEEGEKGGRERREKGGEVRR